MIVRLLVMSACLLVGFGAAARAADSPNFDDPGMHFSAPAGWARVDLGQPGDDQQDAPAAVFTYHAGQNDQRSIVITIASFDGSLDAFETNHLSNLHSGEATFVEKKTKTALANGMPAYFIRVSSGSEAGKFLRRYEYLIVDGTRSIVVAYAGRQGDFDEKDALAALSSLYVVVYPHKHA